MSAFEIRPFPPERAVVVDAGTLGAAHRPERMKR